MSTNNKSFALTLFATTVVVAVSLLFYAKKKSEKSKEFVVEDGVGVAARVFADKEVVAKELCNYIVGLANESIAARGKFHLAVAGGSLLDLLENLKDHKGSLDFSKVVLSFANHKCVTPDDAKATYAKAKSKFADAVGITKVIKPSPTVSKEGDGTTEAAFYARALKEAGVPHSDGFPVMDLVLLGLGADGHVGSNHPNGPAVLNENNLAVAGSPKVGEPSSITYTIATMNKARNVVVVVCGGSKGKKEAVKRAMVRPAEQPIGSFPAQLLKSPLFFLDTEAASGL